MTVASLALGFFLVLQTTGQSQRSEDASVADRIAQLNTAQNEEAVSALAKAGKPAVAPLVELLVSGEPDAAWQAVRILRAMGAKADSGKSRLVATLRGSNFPPWRRGMAAAALGGSPTGSVIAVGPLVAALQEDPPSELQLLSACALVEIGEPAVAALAKELANKDRMAGLWAANLLVELGDKAGRARVPLLKVVQPEKSAEDGLCFLLHPSVVLTLKTIRADYNEPPSFNDSVRILKLAGDKKAADFSYDYRGGVLPLAMMTEPARVRELLASSLGLGKDDPNFKIALPERFEDTDRNDEFSAGEMVQGLGNHLWAIVHSTRTELERDSIRSLAEWKEALEPARGLMLAVHALTRPEFLRESKCLERSVTRFEGLIPP